MKKRIALLLCVCLLACACVLLTGCGKDEEKASNLPSPGEDFYYYDSTDVLSKGTEAVIYFNNKSLEKACGSQIVVAVVPTRGSKTAQTYAYQLFNHWGIGDAEKDNGFLILMCMDPGEEDVWVTEGSGASSIIRAGELKTLLNEEIYEPFMAGDFEETVNVLFRALFEEVRDYYGVNLAFADENALIRQGKYSSADAAAEGFGGAESGGGHTEDGKPETGCGGSGMSTFIIIVIIAFIIIAVVSSGSRGAVRSAVRRPIVFFSPAPRRRTGGYYSAPRPRSGSFSRPSSGFGSSRPSSSGSTRSSSFSSSRSGGFGGARGGGGHSSGGGAGLHR